MRFTSDWPKRYAVTCARAGGKRSTPPSRSSKLRAMVRDILELGGSLGFLDELYDRYKESGDVDASWVGLLGDQPDGGTKGPSNGTNGHSNGTNGTNGHHAAIAATGPLANFG